MNTDPNRTAGSMLSDALGHISSLVRSEVDLARAEVNENITKALAALGMIVGAVVMLLTALNVLAAAVVAALAEAGIPPIWAAVIVGAVLAIISLLMVSKGTSDLKATSLAPTRTAQNVKRDAQAIKEIYNDK